MKVTKYFSLLFALFLLGAQCSVVHAGLGMAIDEMDTKALQSVVEDADKGLVRGAEETEEEFAERMEQTASRAEAAMKRLKDLNAEIPEGAEAKLKKLKDTSEEARANSLKQMSSRNREVSELIDDSITEATEANAKKGFFSKKRIGIENEGISSARTKLEEGIKEADGKLSQANSTLAEEESKLKELEKVPDGETVEAKEAREAKVEAQKTKVTEAQRAANKARLELKEANRRFDSFTAQTEYESALLRDEQAKADRLKNATKEAGIARDEAKSELNEAEQELRRAKETSGEQQDIEKKEQRVKDLKQKYEQAEEKFNNTEKEWRSAEEDISEKDKWLGRKRGVTGWLGDKAESVGEGFANEFERTGSGFRSKIEDFKKAYREKGGVLGMSYDFLDSLNIGHTLISAVLFMVPNIIQASMENEAERAAELKTIATPKKYGNWVVQMLTEAINSNHPSMSIPLYAMIPAENTNATLSQATAKAFGLGINNKVKEGKLDDISRYQINASSIPGYFVNSNLFAGKLVMSYPEGGPSQYSHIGDSPITGGQFGGLLVDLNDGYIIRANGERYTLGDSDVSPPLIPMSANAPTYQRQAVKSIQESLSHVLEKMQTTGMVQTYKEYEGTDSGANVGKVLSNLFNDQTAITVGDKSAGKSLLYRSLQKYKNSGSFGIYTLNPMVGWGTDNTLVQHIAGLNKDDNKKTASHKDGASSGTVSSDANSGDTALSVISTGYGDPQTNYAAEGCWVYTSTNTPFVKALQDMGASEDSVSGLYVDYIICFDSDMNQVPLKVPVEQIMYEYTPKGSKDTVVKLGDQDLFDKDSETGETNKVVDKWPTIGINPKVEYVASLISTSMAQFQIESNGKMSPVVYDKNGKKATTSNDDGARIKDAVEKVIGKSDGTIGTLQSNFPKLYSQFEYHSKAMLDTYLHGPFVYGDLHLLKSDYSVQVGSSSVDLYDGGASTQEPFCYPGTHEVEDLLLPLSIKSGGMTTVVLPSSTVTHFASLVTDITYRVETDGHGKKYLVADEVTDFQHAPGTIALGDGEKLQFTLDNKLSTNYYYLGLVAGQAPKGDKNIVTLETYVQEQRQKWINALEGKTVSAGAKHGKFTYTPAGLKSTALEDADCYMYKVSPSPTSDILSQDWFIAVASQAPSFANLQMLNMDDATDKENASSLVSLVTGRVYDMDGNPRKTSAGRFMFFRASGATVIDSVPEYLHDYFAGQRYDNVLTDEFITRYGNAVESYQKKANQLVNQGEFADIPLSIYASDLASGNYIYLRESDDKREVVDAFVTFGFDENGKVLLEQPLTDRTENLLSLVTADVYKRNVGLSHGVSMDVVINYIQTHKATMRRALAQKITSLQSQYIDQKKAEAAEEKDLDKDAKPVSKITLTKDQAQRIINRLGKRLAPPYDSLKQDPLTKKYVHLSPANPNNPNEFIYLMFDVPNSYKVGTKVGGIYTEKGELIQELKGSALEAMKHQFGLYGDATKLGIPAQQPSMLMDRADKGDKLILGKDGVSMISNTSTGFPGPKINKMPSGYYLYYNITMNTYYVFDKNHDRWTGVVGGNLYNRSGKPIATELSVAVNDATGAAKDDMILLSRNNSGYMQGAMMDQNANNLFASFTNNGSGQWSSNNGEASVIRTESSLKEQTGLSGQGDEYTVRFGHNDQKRYKVTNDYVWEPLLYIPLSKDGTIVAANDRPARSLQQLKLVKKNDEVVYGLFNGIMHKTVSTKQDGNDTILTMKPVKGDTGSMTVKLTQDAHTNSYYVSLTTPLLKAKKSDGSYTSNKALYGYVYDSLNDDQQDALRNKLQGTITTCPASMPVDKQVSKPTTQADGSVKHEQHQVADTHVLFVSDIDMSSLEEVSYKDIKNMPEEPKKPDSGSDGILSEQYQQDLEKYQLFMARHESFTNSLFRVQKEAGRGRFFARLFKARENNTLEEKEANKLYEPFISYFNRDGHVDLQTGALFDNNGRSLGISLRINDWLLVLDKLNVTVNYNKVDGVPELYFRDAATVKLQESQQKSDADIIQKSGSDVIDETSIDDTSSTTPSLQIAQKSTVATPDENEQAAGMAETSVGDQVSSDQDDLGSSQAQQYQMANQAPDSQPVRRSRTIYSPMGIVNT